MKRYRKDLNNNTVIVTGATGFIGPYILKEISNLFDTIIVLHRFSSNKFFKLSNIKNIKFYKNDNDIIEDLFVDKKYNIEGVIHLATHYAKTHEHNDISKMLSGNISLPLTLLSLSNKYNINWFINTGTCFEYNLSNIPIKETNQVKPINLYAETKLSFYNMINHILSVDSILNVLTLRLFYAYGVNNYKHKLIQHIIRNSIEGNKILLNGGNDKIDFINVHDIASAYKLSIEYLRYSIEKGYKIENIFNIGTGRGYTQKNIINIVDSILGVKSEVAVNSDNNIISKTIISDPTKAYKVLGWKSKIDIEEGINEIISNLKDKL